VPVKSKFSLKGKSALKIVVSGGKSTKVKSTLVGVGEVAGDSSKVLALQKSVSNKKLIFWVYYY